MEVAGKKDLIHKSLAVGITFLFIASTVTPAVISIDEPEDGDEYLENLNFDSYHVSEITNNDFKETNLFGSELVISSGFLSKPFTSKPIQTANSGLMDSAWPMFGHDVRHTGRSPYIPVEYPIEKWRYDIVNGGYGSPIIDSDGTIYFGGNRFYAFLPNGTLKWTYEEPMSIHSSPAIDENGIIYVSETNGGYSLYAFYPNGTLKWKEGYGEIYSSPVIGEDGTIYFGRASGDDGDIFAVYPDNGTVKWVFHTDNVVYSSPAIGDDGTIYCGSHDQNLYALFPNNGTEKWRYHTAHWIRTSPCIADDGTIYVVSLDSNLHAVNPDGTMKWKTDVGAGTSPTIGQDGTIYCGYAYLHAVNPDNGTIKWSFYPGEGRKIRGGTPCNDANGIIYFGTSTDNPNSFGEIIVVNPDGTEKWRKQISNNYLETAPCISEDGVIYVVSDSWYDGRQRCLLHSFGTIGDNNPPVMQLLDGRREGKINEYYSYYFYASDPDNNPVGYFVDWGDGTSEWTMDYEPDVDIDLSHEWDWPGRYTIMVKARDTSGEESDWMTLEVRMPVNQQPTFSLLELFRERFPLLHQLFQYFLQQHL